MPFKHGHTRKIGTQESTRVFQTWSRMLSRCKNPKNKDYPNYGGRGITVCERWLEFVNFLEDMGDRPSGMSIDRINNDLGYFKENCRWTTPKQQNRNTRANRILTLNGTSHCMGEWAEIVGMKDYIIKKRLKLGWSVERSLTTTPRKFIRAVPLNGEFRVR